MTHIIIFPGFSPRNVAASCSSDWDNFAACHLAPLYPDKLRRRLVQHLWLSDCRPNSACICLFLGRQFLPAAGPYQEPCYSLILMQSKVPIIYLTCNGGEDARHVWAEIVYWYTNQTPGWAGWVNQERMQRVTGVGTRGRVIRCRAIKGPGASPRRK